jgi:hypothetical protein
LHKSVAILSRRRVATVAIVVLAVGVVRGAARDSSSPGDRGHVTITAAAHHRAPASVHLDGVVPIAVSAFVGLLWAAERIVRFRAGVPAAASLIRRRGPPRLLAY